MKKELAVFKIVSGNYVINLGDKDIKIKKDELNTYKDKYTFIYVDTKRDPITEKDANGEKVVLKELKDILKFYNECQTQLFTASKGFIDLHQSPSFSKQAIRIWNILKKKSVFKESEPLSDIEIEFLHNTKGAIMFGSEYEGEGHLYDIVSAYPSILFDINTYFPIKPPIEKTIKKWSETMRYSKMEYGYYRCKIEKSKNEIADRLFKFKTKDNIYTHIDIQIAMKLKLKYTLIVDGKPNMWYYPPSHLEKSHKMFSKFVGYMFKLKQQGIKGAKNILTCLWGALCGGNKDYIDMKETNTRKETRILNIELNTKGEMTGVIVEKEKPYKYSYARIKPFVYSFSRQKLVNLIHPFGDKIVRANTDGFISKEKLDIPTGEHLGGLMYEGYSKHITVKNSNNVTGNKKKDIIKPQKDETESEELERLNREFEKLLNETA